MVMPEAVDDDATGEGVVRMDDPVGQGAASFAFGPVVAAQFGRRMLGPAEGRGRDLFAEVLGVATSVHLDDGQTVGSNPGKW